LIQPCWCIGYLRQNADIGAIYLCDAYEATLKQYDSSTSYTDYKLLIDDQNPDAVFICSSTPSHYPIIKYCCEKKIDVFCEKPLDLQIERIHQIKELVDQSGIILQVGFNRRFDPDFALLKKRIADGDVGDLHQITIISRDPDLPSMEYIAASGGIFNDMTIHDFDMAHHLTGSEVVEVYAKGQRRIDKTLMEYNDIDTATVVLTFANETTCTIINSRRAVYGYDQRIEVFGSKGSLSVGNVQENRVEFWSHSGIRGAKVVNFFLERYQQTYALELEDFIETVGQRRQPSVDVDDALRASEIAVLANESLKTNSSVFV